MSYLSELYSNENWVFWPLEIWISSVLFFCLWIPTVLLLEAPWGRGAPGAPGLMTWRGLPYFLDTWGRGILYTPPVGAQGHGSWHPFPDPLPRMSRLSLFLACCCFLPTPVNISRSQMPSQNIWYTNRKDREFPVMSIFYSWDSFQSWFFFPTF